MNLFEFYLIRGRALAAGVPFPPPFQFKSPKLAGSSGMVVP